MKHARRFAVAWSLLKETAIKWIGRDPFRNSTVIAYYTIFSMPGLLVIIINIAGYFFGDDAVTHRISGQVGQMIGDDAARAVEAIVARASQHKESTISSLVDRKSTRLNSSHVK